MSLDERELRKSRKRRLRREEHVVVNDPSLPASPSADSLPVGILEVCPKDRFMAIERIGTDQFWDGHGGWTDVVEKWFKTTDPQELNDALIAISSLNVDVQPLMIQLTPVEVQEGKFKGQWVIQVNAQRIGIKRITEE